MLYKLKNVYCVIPADLRLNWCVRESATTALPNLNPVKHPETPARKSGGTIICPREQPIFMSCRRSPCTSQIKSARWACCAEWARILTTQRWQAHAPICAREPRNTFPPGTWDRTPNWRKTSKNAGWGRSGRAAFRRLMFRTAGLHAVWIMSPLVIMYRNRKPEMSAAPTAFDVSVASNTRHGREEKGEKNKKDLEGSPETRRWAALSLFYYGSGLICRSCFAITLRSFVLLTGWEMCKHASPALHLERREKPCGVETGCWPDISGSTGEMTYS